MTALYALISAGALLLPVLGMSASARRADDLTGTWDVKAVFTIAGGPAHGQSHDMVAVLEFVQKGSTLTGTFIPIDQDLKTEQGKLPISGGRVTGSKVSFSVKPDNDISLDFALVLTAGRLRGRATPNKPIPGGGTLTVTVEATRRKK